MHRGGESVRQRWLEQCKRFHICRVRRCLVFFASSGPETLREVVAHVSDMDAAVKET